MKMNLTKINQNIKLSPSINKIDEYIEENNKYLKGIERRVKSFFGISEMSLKILKDILKVKKITDIVNPEILNILSKNGEAGKEEIAIRELIIKQIAIKNKIGTLNSIKELTQNNNLKPELYLNKDGNKIRSKNHSFNFLNNKEIKDILGFNEFVEFKNIEDLENFILKYFKFMRKYNELSTYFIVNNTLFFDFISFNPICNKRYKIWSTYKEEIGNKLFMNMFTNGTYSKVAKDRLQKKEDDYVNLELSKLNFDNELNLELLETLKNDENIDNMGTVTTYLKEFLDFNDGLMLEPDYKKAINNIIEREYSAREIPF